MCGLASEVVLNQNLYYLKSRKKQNHFRRFCFHFQVKLLPKSIQNLRVSVMRLLWAASMCGSLENEVFGPSGRVLRCFMGW